MAKDLTIPELHLFASYQGKPIFLDEKWMKVRGSVETKAKFRNDVELLVQQIRANGFESSILVLDCGDKFTVLDGYRRCFAFAEVVIPLIREGKPLVAENGRPLEIRCEVYDGDLSEDAIVARIVRNILARSNIGDGEKKNLILIIFTAEAARGVFRATNWVAADLGVSQRWLADVRNQAIAEGVLPWTGEYKARDGRMMRSGISQPRRKIEGLQAPSSTSGNPTTTNIATTTTPAASGAAAAETKSKGGAEEDTAALATAAATTPTTTTSVPTDKPNKSQSRSPRYAPEQHPATEAVCALVKDSQRQPNDLDPEGRLGVEGLVNRHDLDTPLGRALSEFLDPLFAALGIDLDLALRHFAAMMKDSITRKEVAEKAEKKTRNKPKS